MVSCGSAFGQPLVFQEELVRRENGQRASSITDSMW